MYIPTILLFWFILSSTLMNSAAVDTIGPHQTIKDGDTIISAGGEFELGFFSPDSSRNRYLGIWYKKISVRTVVWVANRDHPLLSTSGVVRMTDRGITLQSLNTSDGIIWSMNASRFMRSPAVQLLDTGNLVLRDEDKVIEDAQDFIWQSFDHPMESMLPGMKFGVDLVTGIDRYYTSWKSVDDPSSGSFTYRLDYNGFPQFLLWKGSRIWTRNGLWNGYKLGGIPNYNPNGIYKYKFVLNEKEIYFGFYLINQTAAFIRLALNPSGEPKLLVWNDQQEKWIVYLSLQDTDCDRYNLCGAYGISRLCRSFECLSLCVFIFANSLCMCLTSNIAEDLNISLETVALTEVENEDLELPLFEFEKIANATSNFSNDNKLGEGGFGPVYKGTLDDGREVAVKRLSKDSSQGLEEFKNEVSCIAKLQHRNLVTLFGCCTEKGEKILIYEYMANKALDSFIFDEKIRNTIDWPKRYNIINGIARGLMYLHQDSKLRIIHRDLKASNILLDHELNPKISDFGIARSFGGSETEANTSRVVGTYGYMSPEYAIDGQFSVKSDVYSFGVLLIEIVSGVKNRLFSHPDHSLNLLGHAWMSYKEDKLLQLIDEVILESSNYTEVFRAIQIGLLCVQHHPKDRPVMSQVVLMLSSNMKLPHPKQPGFFMERCLLEAENLLSSPKFSFSNYFTITSLLPRQ